MGTSLSLFNSWKSDPGMNCIEATNHKECAGKVSRRLAGSDLSAIETT